LLGLSPNCANIEHSIGEKWRLLANKIRRLLYYRYHYLVDMKLGVLELKSISSNWLSYEFIPEVFDKKG
jgi:hypothetical protein